MENSELITGNNICHKSSQSYWLYNTSRVPAWCLNNMNIFCCHTLPSNIIQYWMIYLYIILLVPITTSIVVLGTIGYANLLSNSSFKERNSDFSITFVSILLSVVTTTFVDLVYTVVYLVLYYFFKWLRQCCIKWNNHMIFDDNGNEIGSNGELLRIDD